MKILSKIRDLHDELYKLTLIFLSVLTIVYFLPRESTFKYEYQLNKPWYYDDLIAPYDIPVFPTQNEILTIQKEIKLNSKAYYNFEPSVINQQILKFNDLLNKKQKILNDEQFIWIKNNMQKIKTEYKSIFSNIFFQVQKHLTRRKKQIPLCLLVRKRQCLSHFFNYGKRKQLST